MDAYDHTQKGILHWLVAGTGAVCLASASAAINAPAASWIVALLVAVGGLFLLLAPCFARLRVRDTGDALEIAFGPWRLFKRRVRYDEIVSADIGRSTLVDGWGIHRIPGRGWIWNIHGFRCVRLEFRDGSVLRVGTDEPEQLETLVRTRIG